MTFELNLDESPAAQVLNFAEFKKRREAASRPSGWSFHVTPDGRMTITTSSGDTYTFGAGSGEAIGRHLLNTANHYRRQAEQDEAQRVHLPAIRAAMNDAIVAARGGGRDAVAEETAERLRHSGWTWSMLEKRERDRWLRHMRKRRGVHQGG